MRTVEYIYTKDNDLSDPLSRGDVALFRRNAYKRGLAIMINSHASVA